MWKCKECGGEIIAETEIHTTIDFRMNRNESFYDVHGFHTLHEIVEDQCDILGYKCIECDEDSENLYEIAYWED